MMRDQKTLLYLGLGIGGVLLLAVYGLKRWGVGNAVSAGVRAAGDAVAGGVLGVGDVVGIPRTNQHQCEKDIAASFSCPTGTFLGSLIGRRPTDTRPAIERPYDPADVYDPRDAWARRTVSIMPVQAPERMQREDGLITHDEYGNPVAYNLGELGAP
jgi:hypothetical protein